MCDGGQIQHLFQLTEIVEANNIRNSYPRHLLGEYALLVTVYVIAFGLCNSNA